MWSRIALVVFPVVGFVAGAALVDRIYSRRFDEMEKELDEVMEATRKEIDEKIAAL